MIVRLALTCALVLALFSEQKKRTFLYVPPLTRVPELSLSLLGQPEAQPQAVLPEICRVSRCDPALLQRTSALLEQGKELRLELQALTVEMLEAEPSIDPQLLLGHRSAAEQSIGELNAWRPLKRQVTHSQ